ncbi:MAG: hypothetical protein V7L31_05450 [Nostoc sp.]|uniref:hypothetical protein n=2 Tax=unclassified Nostoc TaxID=2593658 RepID=UPI002FF23676
MRRNPIVLLLSGVIVSFGLSSLLAQAQQVSDALVAAMVEALRLAAPQTGTANDGLYSEYTTGVSIGVCSRAAGLNRLRN